MARRKGAVAAHLRPHRAVVEAYLSEFPTADVNAVDTHLRERLPKMEAPDLTTLRRWLRDLAPNPSDPWSLVNANPDDARYVLPALAARAMMGWPRPSVADAEWLVRLGRALPGIPAADLVSLAHLYLIGVRTDDLDVLVAFAPWTDEGEAYARAVRSGRVRWDSVVPLRLPSAERHLMPLLEERVDRLIEARLREQGAVPAGPPIAATFTPAQ